MQIKSVIDNKFYEKLLLISLLISIAIIYYPGLNSRFLLDDFYNLAGLSEIQSNGVAYYIFSGFAGPLGRPLSLFSFALQSSDWPHNPFAFKFINLFIHLLNGALLFFICKRLTDLLDFTEKYKIVFSFLTTALWLIHPIQLSTVLYAVQRMTQLSALFTLIGILGYLHARNIFLEYGTRSSLIKMSIYVVVGTLFATLCKENGILLPLYILIIELTLFASIKKTDVWMKWACIFLLMPLSILIIYMVANFDNTLLSYQSRSYSLFERLITEPGVLLTYIKNIVVPSYGAFSLYHDDYPISTSLVTSPSTLISVLIVFILIVISLLFRKRLPIISFSILWFFGGHILESTYLNLELYYEHRNYLPSFGILFLINWLILIAFRKIKVKLVILSFVILLYTLNFTVTLLEIRIWSQPVIQAMEWARLHPDSVRALDDLAALHINNENYDKANVIYERIQKIHPASIYPSLQKIIIKSCKQNIQISENEWQSILDNARLSKPYGLRVIAGIDLLIVHILENKCEKIDRVKLTDLLMIMINNPEYSYMRDYLYEFLATLNLFNQNYETGLMNIREAIRYSSKPDNFIYEIRLLKLLGDDYNAKDKIQKFKDKFYKDPRLYFSYNPVISLLE